MSAVEGIAKNEELRKRIGFTLFVLVIYRLGVHIPTPGVDGNAVMNFFQSQGGFFNVFNLFSGGALERFSVLALGIMPYISSSIIFQLLTSVIPQLEQLKKEGESGRKKINQYTRYGTIVLAIVQGYGISTFLKNPPGGEALVLSNSVGFLPFELMTIITLTAGTCFLMWLGEQITERGIGNGASLIIFAGIAANIPAGISQTYNLVADSTINPLMALVLAAFMIITIGLVIFLEVGQRRIPIQYSARGQGRQAMSAPQSHLPLKINFSGVIPPIFASSLLLFPATITQFVQAPWLQSIQDSLAPNGTLYNVLFVGLIVFFCFFYTQIVFNPSEVAENLKKSGGFVPGIRAGKATSDYIMRILDRINVGGAIYLSAICILPGLLIATLGVPFYFGGTSLLILVGVALDTTQQIQSHMLNQKYDAFSRGPKVKMKSRRVQF
ncbi:MAG: preprotein translocase subunit SecY [Bdellovibrionota bacterium]|nr:preprotein translocase subunit SecY [Pseudobdellovibrionaceae bacterium]MEC9282118.1 preprotein translocase subunit SecY [Bdellovibrionota bacterium]